MRISEPQAKRSRMMSRLWRACLLGYALFPAATALAATPQAALDGFAENLGYHFTIISNKVTDGCPDKPVQQHCYSAALDLTMPKTMPAGEWWLYLGFVE